ncbi:hypothetical protein CRJUMX01_1320007 [Escherichia coli]|nr:hypothetical protein CRJUMX01_1320007 [Escherichia coli]
MKMNKRNARQRLKAVLLTGGILLAFMVVALFIADVAIRHPEGTAAFSTWMQAHRSGWLIWRLFIYICWAGVSGVLYMRRDSGRNTASH